ncbi:MAG: TetR/AcrR family transcriptional regulator [Candidatus Marinimicrobia bacterium]|nr:TetR/AcrR family transcriptional regulator [Candidatus Neomarinimicrobiota bacterium]
MTERRPSSERRKEILEAALTIFVKKGYSDARMDDIVQEIGLSKGAIYYHFQSKRDLFIALIEHWMDQFDAIERSGGLKAKPSGVIIKKIARFTAKIFQRNPNWFLVEPEIWAFANRDKQIKELASQLYSRVIAVFESLIERGIEYGEFNKVNSRLVALSIMTSLHGMIWFVLFQPEDFSLEDYVDLNMECILSSIVVQKKK